MTQHWNRRDILKAAGLAAGASLLPSRPAAAPEAPPTVDYREPERPLTCIVIGAGNRGNVYARYAERTPKEWKIVGVAEPIPERRERMARTHGIPEESQFTTWEHVFNRDKFADVLIITTPDHLHHGPAMAGLEKGYDELLEKPIARTWEECRDIYRAWKKSDRIVAICHVLRYTPYWRQVQHVVQSGQIGDVVSVQHLEPVEHIHMSHSFVRGNWRNSNISTPIILSKSCHDLDILRWVIDKPCRQVSSWGWLTYFREENAPEGAPKRCTDGCPVSGTCPFYAPTVYIDKRLWGTYHLNAKDNSREAVMETLRTGPYGRCVFHCDNNVCDHQITNMVFESNVTCAFSLEGMTSYGGRRTRIMGTKGDLVGDDYNMDIFDFSTRGRTHWDPKMASATIGSGHGGGDWGLVRDFVQAVSRRDPSLLTSTLDASMESHLMAFQAEVSRANNGRPEQVDLDA